MRISDWSSDVCSSDLLPLRRRPVPRDALAAAARDRELHPLRQARLRPAAGGHRGAAYRLHAAVPLPLDLEPPAARPCDLLPGDPAESAGNAGHDEVARSEEHPSELQSLMRISYA